MRATILIAAAVCALALAAPTAAWTQWNNKYPNDPVSCTGTPPYECIRWAKTSSNLSIHVGVYAHPSLDAITSVDFRSILTNSRNEWNAAPARNPFLDAGGSNSPIIVATFAPEEGCVFGTTTAHYNQTSPYRMTGATIRINSLIQWNTTHTWVTNAIKASNCKGDARKVMTHELGHAQALGHTGISPAVMRTGATTYWKPQANDELGLQNIYGKYP